MFHCELDNLNMTTTNVHDINIVNIAGGIMLTNVLPIVQVIDKNILRWFGHVRMREEEETNTKVARQYRSPPERTEYISERSPRNENVSRIDNIGGQ